MVHEGQIPRSGGTGGLPEEKGNEGGVGAAVQCGPHPPPPLHRDPTLLVAP